MTYITKVMHTHDSKVGKEESKRLKGILKRTMNKRYISKKEK